MYYPSFLQSISYITLGNRHVLVKDVDEIFEILERLLWDHAHQDVRTKVAELLNTLRLRKRACSLVLRYYKYHSKKNVETTLTRTLYCGLVIPT